MSPARLSSGAVVADSMYSDFPGGEGEAHFVGRVRAEDIKDKEAQRMFGLTPFEVPADASQGEKNLIEAANRILFP